MSIKPDTGHIFPNLLLDIQRLTFISIIEPKVTSIFLKELKRMDENGKVRVADIVDYFVEFYTARKGKGLAVEKKASIYYKEDFTRKDVEHNIFANPFKRFEDIINESRVILN